MPPRGPTLPWPHRSIPRSPLQCRHCQREPDQVVAARAVEVAAVLHLPQLRFLVVAAVVALVSSQPATKRGFCRPAADASSHDLFVEETAFGRGFDVTGADGEIAETFAFLTLRGIAADDRGEFVDDVLRFH